LRVAFAGTPDFSVPALAALLQSGHQVVGVLTRPDRPRGRGQHLAPSPVKQAATEAGLPICQPLTLKTEDGREALARWQPDVLVVVAYGLILPPAVLSLPRMGCVNIHASLLPRWRGAAPIQRAILAGDAETGTTIMLMDAGLDTGPMLAQRKLLIERHDTGGSLHDRLAVQGSELLIEALRDLEAGTLRPVPQPNEGVTYAAKLEKSEARMEWAAPAVEIERKVRAFNPWPIAETRYEGEQLRILRATAVLGTPAGPAPGTVLALDDATADQRTVNPSVRGSIPSLLVQCGEGQLAVHEVQRPGKRPVSARDFANTGAVIGRVLG
jgi:methionyl-tRNA formyltransferase